MNACFLLINLCVTVTETEQYQFLLINKNEIARQNLCIPLCWFVVYDNAMTTHHFNINKHGHGQ